MTLYEFRRVYPARTMTLRSGKPFTYRYYKHPGAKAALVLLTGGIGLSDLFYLHFQRFAADFSVPTFDYQLPFADNGELADAVAELLDCLGERAWLMGQSLGGVIAQIIAVRHPEAVEGLVLSNTCSLSRDMDREAYRHLQAMLESRRKSKRLLSVLPFPLFKRLLVWAVRKKTGGFTWQETDRMEKLCEAMLELLTKEYELHMMNLLLDTEHFLGMTREDFARWEDRVLLLLSQDDDTFNQACKDDLVSLMSRPTVVTDLTGGHLALLVRPERYAQIVTAYIGGRVSGGTSWWTLASTSRRSTC